MRVSLWTWISLWHWNAELVGSRYYWNAELHMLAFEVETRPWLRFVFWINNATFTFVKRTHPLRLLMEREICILSWNTTLAFGMRLMFWGFIFSNFRQPTMISHTLQSWLGFLSLYSGECSLFRERFIRAYQLAYIPDLTVWIVAEKKRGLNSTFSSYQKGVALYGSYCGEQVWEDLNMISL